MPDEAPIMNRLLKAIADSENEYPSDDGRGVDLSRKDAIDAAKRIAELLIVASELATALDAVAPDHDLLGSTPAE